MLWLKKLKKKRKKYGSLVFNIVKCENVFFKNSFDDQIELRIFAKRNIERKSRSILWKKFQTPTCYLRNELNKILDITDIKLVKFFAFYLLKIDSLFFDRSCS